MVCHTGAHSIPGLADFEEMVITYYLIDSPTQYRYTTTRDVSTQGMDLSVGLGHVQPGLTISFSGQIPVFTGNEISFRNFGEFRSKFVEF